MVPVRQHLLSWLAIAAIFVASLVVPGGENGEAAESGRDLHWAAAKAPGPVSLVAHHAFTAKPFGVTAGPRSLDFAMVFAGAVLAMPACRAVVTALLRVSRSRGHPRESLVGLVELRI